MANDMKTLLMQAAELRAAGCSWATVGKELQRSPATVQRWPARYVSHWKCGPRRCGWCAARL